MRRIIPVATEEFLRNLYNTHQTPEPKERCPSCGVNPMSTAPWGQCRDCLIASGQETSMGDTTGERTSGEEFLEWNRNMYGE